MLTLTAPIQTVPILMIPILTTPILTVPVALALLPTILNEPNWPEVSQGSFRTCMRFS